MWTMNADLLLEKGSGQIGAVAGSGSECCKHFVPERTGFEEPPDDVACTYRADDGSLAHSGNLSQENQGGCDGYDDHGAVNSDFHSAESPLEGVAERQAEPLGRQRDHVSLHEGEDAEGADDAPQECIAEGCCIVRQGEQACVAQAEIQHVAENESHNYLQELNGLVLAAKKCDLHKNKQDVYADKHAAYCAETVAGTSIGLSQNQMGYQSRTGDGVRPEVGQNGEGYALCQNEQTEQQDDKPHDFFGEFALRFHGAGIIHENGTSGKPAMPVFSDVAPEKSCRMGSLYGIRGL